MVWGSFSPPQRWFCEFSQIGPSQSAQLSPAQEWPVECGGGVCPIAIWVYIWVFPKIRISNKVIGESVRNEQMIFLQREIVICFANGSSKFSIITSPHQWSPWGLEHYTEKVTFSSFFLLLEIWFCSFRFGRCWDHLAGGKYVYTVFCMCSPLLDCQNKMIKFRKRACYKLNLPSSWNWVNDMHNSKKSYKIPLSNIQTLSTHLCRGVVVIWDRSHPILLLVVILHLYSVIHCTYYFTHIYYTLYSLFAGINFAQGLPSK